MSTSRTPVLRSTPHVLAQRGPEVVLADAMGWCFGVRDAVEAALAHPHREDLTIVGELVHDETVLATLAAAGIRTVSGPQATIATRHALITAHGAADRVTAELRSRGLDVAEATCPLVRRAHGRLASLVAEGLHPVVVGSRGHVEVLGLTGDFPGASVISGPEEIDGLPEAEGFGVISQTTQVLSHVLLTVEALRAARPSARVRFADTVCHPTKDRQDAVRRLALQVDRVVVVGGAGSHNARRLAETCRSLGTPADRVQRPDELDPAAYRTLRRVGVTAATSAPDDAIQAVVAFLRALAPASPD